MSRGTFAQFAAGAFFIASALAMAGELGSTLGYLLLLTTAIYGLVRAESAARFYRWILAATPFFALGWGLTYSQLETAGHVCFIVGYGAVVGALISLARSRTGARAILGETLILAVSGSVALGHLWWLADGSPTAEVRGLDAAAVVVAICLVATLLGRRLDREVWFLSIGCGLAITLEIGDSFVSMQERFGGQLVVWSALPFLLAALGALWSQGELTDAAPIGLRRVFGLRQMVAAMTALVLPLAVAAHSLYLGAPARAELALSAAIGVSIAGVFRMWVLIRQRDTSYAVEVSLRRLGEDLVQADGRSVPSTASAHLGDLVDGAVSLVVVGGEGMGELWARSGSVEPHRTESTSGPIGLVGGLERLKAAGVATSRHVAVLITPDVGDNERLAIVVANPRPLTEVETHHLRSALTQLSLAWKISRLREQRHRERADARFRALVQDSRDIVMVVGTDGKVDMVSPALGTVLGYPEHHYVGELPLLDVHPDDAAMAAAIGSFDDARLSSEGCDVRLRHRGGHYQWVRMSARDLRNDDEIRGVLLSFVDVNSAKTAELQLRRTEARQRAMIGATGDTLALVDPDQRVTFVSRQVRDLLGFEPAALVGTSIRGLMTEASLETINHRPSSDFDVGNTVELELEMITRDGEHRLCLVRFHKVEFAESFEFVVSMTHLPSSDDLQGAAPQRFDHDELTGLLSRGAFLDRLETMLDEADESVGVLAVDIDDFRTVNDALGHSAGDALLRDVGERLSSVVRDGDLVCRLSGDTFALAVCAADQAELKLAGLRLLDTFNRPFEVGGWDRVVSASMGLAHGEVHVDPDALLRNAETALGRARTGEGATFIEFDEAMHQASVDRFQLVSDLAGAVERDQLRLVYQPIVSIASGQIAGVEALLRWDHPERGFISPDSFVPLAEETGHITKIGRWVASAASAQLREWRQIVPGAENLRVSVNVSFRQIEDPQEIVLLHALLTSELPPERFTLELTESLIIDNPAAVGAALASIGSTGTKIAIDDFGTGAAGFNHLRDLPFDVVKIDRSFIEAVGTDPDADRLVANIVELAAGYGATTVAEGIETPTQLVRLEQLGCDFGQGFYLGQPMDPDQLSDMFLKGRDGSAPFLLQTES